MTERERIRQIIAFALRRTRLIQWKRPNDSNPDTVAEQVLSHLELSNLRIEFKPPPTPHKTP